MNLDTLYAGPAVAAGGSALWYVDAHSHNERTSLGNVPGALHELLPKGTPRVPIHRAKSSAGLGNKGAHTH